MILQRGFEMSNPEGMEIRRSGKVENFVFKRDFRTYFANVCRVNASNEEMILDLGVRDPDEPTKAVMELRLCVTHGHATRIRDLLDKVVKASAEASKVPPKKT